MDTVRELFEHELRDIYYAETRLVQALGQAAQESTDPLLRQGFQEHQQQTQNHVSRLNGVFGLLGETPQGDVCQGIEGLLREKQAFLQQNPTGQLLDMYNIDTGVKNERYEISAYEGLIVKAHLLAMAEAVGPLQANLQEEQIALQKLHSVADTMQSAGPERKGQSIGYSQFARSGAGGQGTRDENPLTLPIDAVGGALHGVKDTLSDMAKDLRK